MVNAPVYFIQLIIAELRWSSNNGNNKLGGWPSFSLLNDRQSLLHLLKESQLFDIKHRHPGVRGGQQKRHRPPSKGERWRWCPPGSRIGMWLFRGCSCRTSSSRGRRLSGVVQGRFGSQEEIEAFIVGEDARHQNQQLEIVR